MLPYLVASVCAALAADAAPEPIVAQAGVDHGRGNLVGIAPWMTPADYATGSALRDRLAVSFEAAQARGWLEPTTVVVLPESLGTWLVVVGEPAEVLDAPTFEAAAHRLGKGHAARYAARVVGSGAKDRRLDAVFHIKAAEMAPAWDAALSDLARTYGVTIVGGSILLPAAQVLDGHLIAASRGRLQNVTAVYGPDGRAHPLLARQVTPDRPRLARGAPADTLPIFATPVGALGVLIGADAWDLDAYDALAAQRVDVIAAPAGARAEPSARYDEAALYAADAGAEAALHVPLRGRLWDRAGGGAPIGMLGAERFAGPDAEGAAVFQLWLGEQPLAPEAEEEAEAALAPAHPGAPP